MTSTRYRLSGVITSSIDGRPASDLRVEAFDRDFFRDQPLGEGTTDEYGRYEITFERSDLTGPLIELERNPDILLRIYRGDEQIHTTQRAVLVDAGRDTRLDVQVEVPGTGRQLRDETTVAGFRVDRSALSSLDTAELLDAYRIVRGRIDEKQFERLDVLERALPDVFPLDAHVGDDGGCREGVIGLFGLLFAERGASDEMSEIDSDTFDSSVTVKEFYTDDIVVKYTTDDGTDDAVPDTTPSSDESVALPDGTAVGTIRSDLADLHSDNTEVAPAYVQRIGLLAQYALEQFTGSDFSMRDPLAGASRIEYRILDQGGAYGGTWPTWDHVEVAPDLPEIVLGFTVPHELFHRVQYRYNDTTSRSGLYSTLREGGARFAAESINDLPNRYVYTARSKTFDAPTGSLLNEGSDTLSYSGGVFWKYVAEQHSKQTGTGDEPTIGVDAYRAVLEGTATVESGDPGHGYTMEGLRRGRREIPWYGRFDRFRYYDSAQRELDYHETTWGNYLIANRLHDTQQPGDPDYDRRFDYKEDEKDVTYDDELASDVLSSLSELQAEVATADDIELGRDESVSRSRTLSPFAARYLRIRPKSGSTPRMVRFTATTSSGMNDPLVQILRLGPDEELIDVHRSDTETYEKTISFDGLEEVVVILASREDSGTISLDVEEVASASDVMVTRWNSRVGTEYETDPRGWSWTWVSPDVMVDNDGDGTADTDVYFDRDNTLKIRLRNRGNADASDITVEFWYQKATPHLSAGAWQPVRNTAGDVQTVSGASLAAGAENWFAVDWAPENDGTDHEHWCVKAEVTVPGDPNDDNKIVLSNFASVVPDPDGDADFPFLVRAPERFRESELIAVPRGRTWTFDFTDPTGTLAPSAAVEKPCECKPFVRAADPGLAGLAVARVREQDDQTPWDGVESAARPQRGTYYPVDERTLPPGVDSESLVTVAHAIDGEIVGGVTYTVG